MCVGGRGEGGGRTLRLGADAGLCSSAQANSLQVAKVRKAS